MGQPKAARLCVAVRRIGPERGTADKRTKIGIRGLAEARRRLLRGDLVWSSGQRQHELAVEGFGGSLSEQVVAEALDVPGLVGAGP